MARRDPAKLKDTTVHFLTLRTHFKKGGHRYWNCECVCGAAVARREEAIFRDATKSCGCQHPRRRKGAEHLSWRGCGDLNGQYYGHLRNMARVRDYAFEVSIEYLWGLFVQQEGRCVFTGLPLCFQTHKDRLKGVEQTASLDRRDVTLGYVEGNLWWVHKDVNEMRKAFSVERYVEVCRLVTEHYGRPKAG